MSTEDRGAGCDSFEDGYDPVEVESVWRSRVSNLRRQLAEARGVARVFWDCGNMYDHKYTWADRDLARDVMKTWEDE